MTTCPASVAMNGCSMSSAGGARRGAVIPALRRGGGFQPPASLVAMPLAGTVAHRAGSAACQAASCGIVSVAIKQIGGVLLGPREDYLCVALAVHEEVQMSNEEERLILFLLILSSAPPRLGVKAC